MNDAHSPGVCNIGPAEIARRRQAGHVGVAATIAVLVLLLAIDAPPAWRLVLTLPASLGAVGYLQAARRFCANFGFRGVYNFGPLRSTVRVDVHEDLVRDRRRVLFISLEALGIGLVGRYWARSPCSFRVARCSRNGPNGAPSSPIRGLSSPT